MEGTIGTIIMFGGNFAPRNWALCEGQLLAINSNTALFSILGTTYGGDGRTTFGLPDLRGRVAMGYGNGPGLTSRALGAKFGSETNTLVTGQLPAHNHGVTGNVTVGVNEEDPGGDSPSSSVLGATGSDIIYNSSAVSAGESLGGVSHNIATAQTGSNQAVNNIEPCQVVNFVICLTGIFPSRN